MVLLGKVGEESKGRVKEECVCEEEEREEEEFKLVALEVELFGAQFWMHKAQSAEAHLVLDGLAVLGVADHCQLQLGHLLHLPVHVDLLQQAAHLAPQQAHRVLLALALGEQRGAGRMDSRHPVLQVGLVAGLGTGGGGGEAARQKI